MAFLLTTRAALVLAAALSALLILLYLRKPQRRRVAVPFMALWDAVLLPEPSARFLGRIQRVGSLLIALAVSGLLLCALTDPKATGVVGSARTQLVLIDAGQHMQARDVPQTRLDAARELARRLLAAKPAAETWQIAQLDSTVTPLGPRTSDAAALHAALRRLAPTDAATSFEGAVEAARNLLDAQPNPGVLLISDGAFATPSEAIDRLRRSGIGLRQLIVGERARNVGIRSFSVRRADWDLSQSEAMLEIENTGNTPEAVELTLRAEGQILSLSQFELAPKSRSTRYFGAITARGPRFEAQIELKSGPDPLAVDDRAYSVLPAPARIRILLVSDGNRYLEAALLLDPTHELSVIDPKHYDSAANYDVVVFDRYSPEVPPALPSLFVAPAPNAHDYPLPLRGPQVEAVEHPTFDTFDNDHPLLKHVALRDVNIARAAQLAAQPHDVVVAASGKTPLIVSGTRNAVPFVALTFDVRHSDLPLRVAWPLLVSHILEVLLPDHDTYQAPLVTGAASQLTLAGTAPTAVLRGPDTLTTRLSIVDQRAWVRPLQAGFYRTEIAGNRRSWAATREPTTSVDIQPRRLPVIAQSEPRAIATPWDSGELWVTLLVLTWLIAWLEWFSARRRWTS